MRQPSAERREDAMRRAVEGEGGVMGMMVWPEEERALVTVERARAQAGEGGTTPGFGFGLVKRLFPLCWKRDLVEGLRK